MRLPWLELGFVIMLLIVFDLLVMFKLGPNLLPGNFTHFGINGLFILVLLSCTMKFI
jgi:hypothetical protein